MLVGVRTQRPTNNAAFCEAVAGERHGGAIAEGATELAAIGGLRLAVTDDA